MASMVRSLAALVASLTAALALAQGGLDPSTGRLPPVGAPIVNPRNNTPSAGPSAPPARGTVLEQLNGVVKEVDRKGHRIVVESGGAQITLSLDRNTMVYTQNGLGTVLDVVPGAQIRAGRNADMVAYWVQVRPTAPASGAPPVPVPGQGTGPAGGAAAPAAEPRGGTPATPAGGTTGTMAPH